MEGWLAVVLSVTLFFGLVTAGMWIRRLYLTRSYSQAQETIRAALQSGQTLTPAAIRAILADYDIGRRDLRAGIVYLAFALAILVAAAVLPSPISPEADWSDVRPFVAGFAAFPGFVGLARLLLHFTRSKDVD